MILFFTSSRPVLWSTRPPIQWVPGALSPGVKKWGREADHLRLIPRSRIRGSVHLIYLSVCLSVLTLCLSVYLSIYSPCGPWPLFHFLNLYTVGFLGQDQPVAKPQPTHTEYTDTDIRVLSGIRTHDPSVRAGEDGLYLRPRVHCDRLIYTSIRRHGVVPN
jgi:hypothetical protein